MNKKEEIEEKIKNLSDSEKVYYLLNRLVIAEEAKERWQGIAKRVVKEKLEENKNNKVVPQPEPRYDDVYFEGLDWLNSLC